MDFINGYSSSAYAFTINDTIYVGNTGANGFYRYDYNTDSWSPRADAPAALFNRTGGIGFAVNGKGYVLGGVDATGTCRSDIWSYDPTTNSWQQKADFPGGKRAFAACFVIGNKAYVLGGIDTIDIPGLPLTPVSDLWQYDAAGDSWVQKANIPYDSSFLIVPFAFSVNDKGYVSCGDRIRLSAGSYTDKDVRTTFEYDTTADHWTPKADYPGLSRSGGVSFVLNNKAYCGTGLNDSSEVCYNDMYGFDAAADTWDTLAPLPFAARTYAVAATTSGGKAYMGTGWHSPSTTVFYQDWWEFIPLNEGIVKTPLADEQLICYPNPCSSWLTLRSSLSGNSSRYEIYSLSGQRCLRDVLATGRRINVSGLTNGVYVITIYNSDKAVRSLFEVCH